MNRNRGVGLSFVFALVCVGLLSGSAVAAGSRRLTVFAVPATAQFMNHADDRVRGMTINPFNVNLKALQLVLAVNGKEKGNGPFPGDDVLYTFDLYSGADLKQSAGSAMFTCYYSYGRRAVCDSYFDLRGGLVLAAGQVLFNSKRFTLGVSGGTSKYLGVGGELQVAPAAGNALRLDLMLLGPNK